MEIWIEFMNEYELIKSAGIRSSLKSHADRAVEYYSEINSTNTYLVEKAKSGAEITDRTLVIAESQTAGKGRLGRSFYSAKKSGIYMSLFLKPDSGKSIRLKAGASSVLTVIAGISVCETLNELTDCGFFIKWVNDILWNDRKICGILAETKISEFPYIDYAVLGIGINVTSANHPEEIRNTAVSLDEVLKLNNKKISAAEDKISEEIISSVLWKIDDMWDKYLHNPDKSEIIERYRKNLGIIGREVNVIYHMTEEKYPAIVKAIDSDACLIVEDESGNEHILNSGEISLKLKK